MSTPRKPVGVTSDGTPIYGAPKGFALLTPEQRSFISSKGGTIAQAAGTAHKFTSEEAKAAGRKGGLATAAKVGAEGMRERGAKGGTKRAENASGQPDAEPAK